MRTSIIIIAMVAAAVVVGLGAKYLVPIEKYSIDIEDCCNEIIKKRDYPIFYLFQQKEN